MNGELNGSTPVTRYELGLALDPVKANQADMRAEMREGFRVVSAEFTEIKADMHTWKVLAERKAFFGGRGTTILNGLMVSVPAGLVGAAVALFIH